MASNLPRETEDRQLREDFKRTFNSPHGKRILSHILDRCHVFHSTYTGNDRTFFLEGERNIGLYLLALMGLSKHNHLEILAQLEEMDNV